MSRRKSEGDCSFILFNPVLQIADIKKDSASVFYARQLTGPYHLTNSPY